MPKAVAFFLLPEIAGKRGSALKVRIITGNDCMYVEVEMREKRSNPKNVCSILQSIKTSCSSIVSITDIRKIVILTR